MELLQARTIKKSYKYPVLGGVSFSVSKGECIGIVGQNGCGKSTLLAILSGAIRADGGELFIRNVDAFKNRRVFAGAVGYVPQTDPLMEELTVKDNLKLWYGMAGRRVEEDVTVGSTLEMLGLIPVLRQRSGTLSGGMKRRLSIAGALAARSEILVFDEPSGGLDVVCRKEIIDYLKLYMARVGGIIIATHTQEELDLCTRVFLLEKGMLIEKRPRISLEEIAEDIIRGNVYGH